MTTIETDWRQARADALLRDADVIQQALDALAEVEACQADEELIMQLLVPFAGVLKARARDLIRAADQLRAGS